MAARAKPASEAREIMLLSHLKGGGQMKKLLFGKQSWEEQSKSIERLTLPRREPKEPKKEPPKRLTGDALAAHITRMYSQEMEHKKVKDLRRAKLYEREKTGKQLPAAAVGHNVQVLCYNAVEHQKNRKEQLRKKHLFHPDKKKLESRARQDEVNDRVYNKALDRRKDEAARLDDEYIKATAVATATRTAAEWDTTLERLYSDALVKFKAMRD